MSDESLDLAARQVPWPRSISERARAFLVSAAKNPPPAYPPLGDIEAWRRHVVRIDAMMLERFRGIGADFRGEVATRSWNGATVYEARPAQARANAAYLDIHGGAFVLMGGEICRRLTMGRASAFGATVFGVDYRMPPDHAYPAALDDCLGAYRHLLTLYRPRKIVVGGSSAGGNLAAALVLRARDEGLPLPGGLVLMSPALDLTESGDSFRANAGLDVVLVRPMPEAKQIYCGNADATHPYLSPLFGNFTGGFPPTFLQTGTRDLLLSNVVRMHRALRKAGVPVEMHIGEAMPHGGFAGAPEDLEIEAEMRRFIHDAWDRA